jgi:ABC-2 type transport system ATP-binding protein
MDEAERLCDRIGVFRAGRVVAVDTPAGLIERYGGGSAVRFTAPPGEDLAWLAAEPGVREVQRTGHRVELRGDGPLLARVAVALGAKGILPPDLRVDLPTLEDVYLRIMGEGRE